MLLALVESTNGLERHLSEDKRCCMSRKKVSSSSRKAAIKAGMLSSVKCQRSLLSGRERVTVMSLTHMSGVADPAQFMCLYVGAKKIGDPECRGRREKTFLFGP